ncbi:MAG: hypothetical protein CR217_06750 [Beijerinckiaceae bacterium]|nr:MAG: hypothetical protein CR217_06750 [Beijerinckiaceae bacterium]
MRDFLIATINPIDMSKTESAKFTRRSRPELIARRTCDYSANSNVLPFVRSTSKKAKSWASCKTFLVAATDASTTPAAVTIGDHHLQNRGGQRFVFDNEVCNVFMGRSLGGRLE